MGNWCPHLQQGDHPTHMLCIVYAMYYNGIVIYSKHIMHVSMCVGWMVGCTRRPLHQVSEASCTPKTGEHIEPLRQWCPPLSSSDEMDINSHSLVRRGGQGSRLILSTSTIARCVGVCVCVCVCGVGGWGCGGVGVRACGACWCSLSLDDHHTHAASI